jgi:UDP-3-O-[3-hydroxymyristoyl] N-acetylglucosamine deacetylase
VTGIGIHTGELCTVVIDAQELSEEIVFQQAVGTILARPEYVVDTSRCTKLAANGASVSTVEHLLSALAGLGIMCAHILVEGPELPILDGSAQTWVEAIQPAMWSPLKRPTRPLPEPITVEGKNGSYITATPSERLRITLTIAYDHPVIGTQTATFIEGEDDYITEIAPARTFGLRSEVDALLAAGLAKGGSLDNAIVVEDDGYSTPLRFSNELARHKILDLLGDLYLSGSLPRADIIAVKPSHTLNVALAATLTEVYR